ncbi:MAG: hypothetical protein PVG65_01060 [Candidatus Thorarchaeota archaeon]|jgi:hypothetical protein
MSDINEQEIINEISKDEISPEMVMNNLYPFEYNDKDYRVVTPNQMQLVRAKQHQLKVFAKLVKDGIPVEKKWIKILKETQDIDIQKLNEEMKRYEKDLIQLHLSKAKTKDSEEKTREKIDKDIREVEKKRLVLVFERADHLSPCANAQAKEEYYRWLTATCTEICVDKENDKWEKVWKNFDGYQKDQSIFPYIALGKLTDLIHY